MQVESGNGRDGGGDMVRERLLPSPVTNKLTKDDYSILFAVTSAISVQGAMYYRRTGTIPGSTSPGLDPSSMEAQTKDAFSSNPQDADYDDDGAIHPEPRGRREDDEYALLHAADADDGAHPSRPADWDGEDVPVRGRTMRSDYDTSYHGGGAYDSHQATSNPFNDDAGPSHDHGGYGRGGRLDFPAADYHR